MLDGGAAQRWGEVKPPEAESDNALGSDLLDGTASAPFSVNEELNFRIALWQGDVTSLKVDALVCYNNEELNERTGICGAVATAAGPQMEEACARLDGCSPGEAKVTRGFRLPAKHVIHTVPPRAECGDEETSLERCYASSFSAALQLRCATIAFTGIRNHEMPRERVAHVALRAVRQLLEQPRARGVQLVLFAMRPQDVYDAMVYDNLLPFYFPRSPAEEHAASKLLPLVQQPCARLREGAASENEATARCLQASDVGCDPNPALVGFTLPPKWPAAPAGCRPHGAAAAAVVNDTAPMGSSADEATLRGSAYASFLQRAGLADLSDIEAMQLFYRAGVDGRGRPVFLFWAGHLPSRPIDLDRVLMHLLRTLDAHAVAAFSIVYVHTTLGPESEPPIGWLRKVHDLFDQRLKDNLHLMYVIHAPWWLKTAMNFMRTFAASGRWWDSKIIQLSHLADLYKLDYFPLGSLRMPDSPIVRKYLEMSDDAHMFEAIAGRHTLGEACAAAFAGSASARALAPCCDELRLAGPPAGRSSAASPAAAEEESRISSEFVAQVQASKGILVQQLIEMSDQVAQARAESEAVGHRQQQMQLVKDVEINRLCNALYEAQRDAEDARRRLEMVHGHAAVMHSEHRGRREALAELSDLEGQLALTQMYNHHMANELLGLQRQVRHDKWAMLHEISSLERQLEVARASRLVEADEDVAHSFEIGEKEHIENQKPAAATNPSMPAPADSRLEWLARLHTDIVQGRGEAASATRNLRKQHSQFEYALKRLHDEIASVRGAEEVRTASSEEHHRELQFAAHDLEQKIESIRAAVRVGREAADDGASAMSTELVELETIVAAAAVEVGRIEKRLLHHSGDALSMSELQELRALLFSRLLALNEQSLEQLLDEVAHRKHGAMQAVAQQFVPQMIGMQQVPVQTRAYEEQLEILEAKAAAALTSIEERFEADADWCTTLAHKATAERERVVSQLKRVEARIDAHASGLPAGMGEAGKVSRAGAPSLHWTAERLALFFEESADQELHHALSRWRAVASYLAGLAARRGASLIGSSELSWVRARAEKVAYVREIDEQAQQLSHVSLALRSDRGLDDAGPVHHRGASEARGHGHHRSASRVVRSA